MSLRASNFLPGNCILGMISLPANDATGHIYLPELELELILFHMTQKPMLPSKNGRVNDLVTYQYQMPMTQGGHVFSVRA